MANSLDFDIWYVSISPVDGERSLLYQVVMGLAPPSLPLVPLLVLLANGETMTATGKRFSVSKGSISQIRKELFLAWHRFQGGKPLMGHRKTYCSGLLDLERTPLADPTDG
jgi:hypothetical protein